MLLHGIAPAGGRRTAATVVDVAAVGAAAAVGALDGSALAVLLGLAALAAQGVDVVRHGQSLGHRLLALRTVDRTTGLPGSLLALLPARGVTADLRRGRDPLRIEPAAATSAREGIDPWASGAATGRAGAVAVALDDGTAVPVLRPTVVGRNPADATGRYALLAVPDLSRTMSRSHALLEPDGATLWVTDLGSGNGTTVVAADGTALTIGAGERARAGVGDRVLLGERVVRVTDHATAGAP